MPGASDTKAPAARPRERMTLLAVALAAGIAVGWCQPRPAAWPWLAASAVTLVGAGVCSAARRGPVLALLVAATACFGPAWVAVRHYRVAPDDLAACLDDAPAVVRVRGVALGPPVLRDRAAGSMAVFDHRPPATYFPLRVRALLACAPGGAETPVRGELLVRVEQTVEPFAAGDRVEATGLLLPPRPPENPGAFDYRRDARAQGRAGLLSVPSRELIGVDRAPPSSSLLRRWRGELRRRACGWLMSDLPDLDSDRARRDALLAALLLGRRGPELDGLGESFRRAGLAHFLAISGLHLGVMAGFVLMLARAGGGHRRWHGWLVIAVVLGYLALIEVRMPVLRAGLMTMAASLGLAAGRRLQVGGLVSASGILLLLWRPDQLFSPGFQLSFGVVLGLIHLSPLLRARWFGPPNAFASSSAEMLGEVLRTAWAVAVTAWLVAAPIAVFHWGVVWPLAAPFSVIVLPVVAVLLAVGYLKMVLAACLPSAALLMAPGLSLAADVLISIVRAMDAVPFSTVNLRHPSAVWSILAEAWVCVWILQGRRVWGLWARPRARRVVGLAGLGLLGWLLVPVAVPPGWLRGPALRVDMLSVGDGSCYVLRSGRGAVVFDAGSASDLDAGRRTIAPALRRLGVRRIEVVVVSHANLDHYSAVLEIVDAFDVGAVLVTPQFLAEAEADPRGPVMFLLDALAARAVRVLPVVRGESRTLGGCRWTWLHPGADQRVARVNDGSMVISVEAAGRRVLLAGDIQRDAMEELLAAGADITADVLELPHHGSHHGRAEAFVARVGPRYVMQSTGRARWERTEGRWGPLLEGAEWLVTARDGACWVEIERDGSIRHGRFLERAGTE